MQVFMHSYIVERKSTDPAGHDVHLDGAKPDSEYIRKKRGMNDE